MGVSLSKGGNVSLSKEAPGLTAVLVGLGWDVRTTTGTDFDLDASAILTNAEGKVLWLDLVTRRQVSPPLVIDNRSWPDRLVLSPDGRMLAMTTTTPTTGGAPGPSTAAKVGRSC